MLLKGTLLGVLVILGCLCAVAPQAWAQPSSSFAFSLPGSSLTQCWFYAVGFNATQGEQIVVLWNETNFPPVSINFYIVPQTSLHRVWDCSDGPQTLYFTDGATGTAKWSAPSTGDYAVVVANYQYYNVSGALSIQAVNAILSAAPIGYGAVRPYQCLGAGCFGGM